MTGRLLGYARVSTYDQDLSLQVDALTKHGILKSNIFMDKLSGAKTDRPGLAKCLDALQTATFSLSGGWTASDDPCDTSSRWSKISEDGGSGFVH